MKKQNYRVARFKDRHNPNQKWAVIYYTPQGVRKREKFISKGEAELWAGTREAETRNIGFQAWDMTDAQRMEAAKCFKILPAGFTLTQAVKELAERAKKQTQTVPVAEAVEDLIADRKKVEVERKKSPRYVLELTSQLRPFVAAFGSRPIRSLEVEEVRDWIANRSTSAVSRNNARGYLSTLWSHAIKKKWAAENPAKEIDAEETDSPPAGVLTPGAMRALLSVAKDRFPSTLPGLLIQGFAGLRDAEVRRLTWEEINLEDRHITVTGMKAKTRTRRTVDISENLAEFLISLNRREGRVTNSCHRMHFAELRKAVIEQGHEWPTNALRHSFVTYRLTESGDENRTAMEAGHTVAMLHEHYKGLVTKKAATAWWGIRPDDSSAGNVLEMPTPARAAGVVRKA